MEILNQPQKDVLGLFGGILDSEYFYLTGGTALSLFYLKHRKSNDLDFFTATEELILSFSFRLEEALRDKKMRVERQRGMRSFVELLIDDGNDKTIIHLACDSPFRLAPINEFPGFPNLKVDNLVDISANKLLALFGRATLRDFIDIYFLIKNNKFTAEELIKNAKIKDPGFDLYWLAIALERINGFKDGSADMFLLLEPAGFNDLVIFFNDWRKEIASNL